MYLEKLWEGVVTAFSALLMTFSMIINESLVACTFDTYTLHMFGNKVIGKSSLIMAVLKIGRLLIFAGGAIYASGFVNNLILRGFSLLGLIAVFSGFLLWYTSSPSVRKISKKNQKKTIS